MVGIAKGRKSINVHAKVERRQELDEIVAYHVSKGREHMSMTKVLEALIQREHKRLKL